MAAITKQTADVIRRGRNVAERMGSVAHDISWAVDYSISLHAILGQIEQGTQTVLPEVAHLAATARKILYESKGTPKLFTTVSNALLHGLVEDRTAANEAVRMLEMQSWDPPAPKRAKAKIIPICDSPQ